MPEHHIPTRSPVMAIARRIIANKQRMDRQWSITRRDITNHEHLHNYTRTLRRADRLENALNSFLYPNQ